MIFDFDKRTEKEQIEAEITKKENSYNKLTIPKIKFFLHKLRKMI